MQKLVLIFISFDYLYVAEHINEKKISALKAGYFLYERYI